MTTLDASLSRYVAVVPGIMGSTLSYSGTEIWGSNILANYRRLLASPAELSWKGKKAEAGLLKAINLGAHLPVRVRLWDKTLDYLAQHPRLQQNSVIECPYDWRQSLQHSSLEIVRLLESRLGASLANEPGPRLERIAIITHSMGALAIRVAIGKKYLHPGWIDRIVHMAPPLLGAPVAFRSLIDRATLPYLNETLRFLHFMNYHNFVELLRGAFNTFDSIFELMPPQDIEFLVEAGANSNPLSGQWFTGQHMKQVKNAMETHDLIRQANTILAAAKMPVLSIFTDFHTGKRTDWRYSTSIKHHAITDTWAKIQGDGTVPNYSSDLSQRSEYAGDLAQNPEFRFVPISNVEHMKMPNHSKAVDLLKGWL